MKRLKIGVILLALLLAAMVMVTMVSAAEPNKNSGDIRSLIEANYIPADLANEHATITMLNMIQSGALDEKWVGAKINPDYQTVYDVNGEKIFYQFTVEKNGAKVGIINAAASKVLGGSVLSIGSIIPSTSLEHLNDYSKKVVAEKFPEYDQISNKLISVDYPVVSQMVSLKNSDSGNEKVLIIDPRYHSIKILDSTTLSADSENLSFYSRISLDEMNQGLSTWEQGSNVIQSLKEAWSSANPEILRNYSIMDISQIEQTIASAKSSTKAPQSTLQDGMVIISGLTHSMQEASDWCAVATAKIISSKYGVSYSQDRIATTMGAKNASGYPTGTDVTMELIYYHASLANYGLNKPSSTYSDEPYTTWDVAVSEINNGLPFKIGDLNAEGLGHARACNGWLINGGNKYLLMYDPGDYGWIYWDYVSSGKTYKNFVFVR
jgi:hypothetical protein